MIVILPIELTNRNDGQGHSWHRTAAEKKRIGNALAHLRRATPLPCPVRLIVTRVLGKGQRLWDADSIGRGNAKQIIDTLTDLGWWPDDGPRHIVEVDYRQDDSRRAAGPCVCLEVLF